MMFFDKETLFTLLTIIFLTYYFSPEKLRQFYGKFALAASKEVIEDEINNVALLGEENPTLKYEDKYLEDIKNMSTEYIFDEFEK